jgi:site-specific recombinase XerD
MGLDGYYVAYDDKGEPWGVLDMRSGTVAPLDHGAVDSVIGTPERRDFAAYVVGEKNLTPSTAFAYEQGLQRIEKFTGTQAHLLKVPDVRRFLRESPYNPSTKSGTLVAVKALHRWGRLEGKAWANPDIDAVPGPKQVINPKDALEPEQAALLLNTCRRPNEFRVIGLGLLGGLRVAESASIGEVEWVGDKLKFMGKGRKVRQIPVHADLAEMRNVIMRNPSTSPGTLKHVCRSLSYVTDIPFTSHMLRHTFARMLRRAGVPREVIGALLGHAPLGVTDGRYAPVEMDEMLDAIGRLTYPTRPVLVEEPVTGAD